MNLFGQRILRKHIRKNKGNRALSRSIVKLIDDFESNDISNHNELLEIRKDADKVYSNSFYFFNLKDHRTMILVEFSKNESTILWCGNHDKYELTFKNNRNTIRKWLKSKDIIK